MQKLIDEFDHLIAPGTIVTEIILSGATYDNWDYTLQENDKADLFIVIIQVEYGFLRNIGEFSDREDAIAYAARMVEKYQAPLTDNTRKLLND
ncbi:hypothetical protein SGGMMB4_03613 [Sodalis glossinidius str. 'morsitans']|uniref:Uncharacterized protein n=1 Tax=Sodalis glossinidius (strain morsitans) TaxID=343509 RepID=A0A193QKD0_SODGM|nr:hypothetical protein [Sodalis glossinidius]CRL45659.1 hypothetical protein SGGMMB4_03613 [Sodalis glossinidius str. 'morsitans']